MTPVRFIMTQFHGNARGFNRGPILNPIPQRNGAAVADLAYGAMGRAAIRVPRTCVEEFGRDLRLGFPSANPLIEM